MASKPVNDRSWAYRIGCIVSDKVSDLFAHPYAQVGFLVLCIGWFAVGWNVNVLTAALSIMAITLTQMVLNSQNEREIDDHRRDIAMHAKLDELIAASKQARNDLVGVEEKEEEEIVQLKEEVKDAIEDAPDDAATRDRAKRAIDAAAEELKEHARKRSGRNGGNARNGSRRQAVGGRR